MIEQKRRGNPGSGAKKAALHKSRDAVILPPLSCSRGYTGCGHCPIYYLVYISVKTPQTDSRNKQYRNLFRRHFQLKPDVRGYPRQTKLSTDENSRFLTSAFALLLSVSRCDIVSFCPKNPGNRIPGENNVESSKMYFINIK